MNTAYEERRFYSCVFPALSRKPMTANETTEAIIRLYPVWIQDSVYCKKDWTRTVVLLSRHSELHLPFRAVSGNVTVVRFKCEQLMRDPLVDFFPPDPRVFAMS